MTIKFGKSRAPFQPTSDTLLIRLNIMTNAAKIALTFPFFAGTMKKLDKYASRRLVNKVGRF